MTFLKISSASLMPSYNGILTVSCIRTLTQIALKLSGFIPLVSVFYRHILLLKVVIEISNALALLQDRVYELVKPFRDLKAIWQVRIEASRALLDLEFHCKGIDKALLLFIKYVEEEPSLRGCESFPLERTYSDVFFCGTNL